MVKDLSPAEAQAFSAPWVRMLGFVQDIESFYRQVDIVVSPVTWARESMSRLCRQWRLECLS